MWAAPDLVLRLRPRPSAVGAPMSGTEHREPWPDWTALQAEARDAGYALLLHGSLMRDVDVVAVPWREEHDEQALVDAFAGHVAVIDHDETDWRGWRSFVAVCPVDVVDPVSHARYFDVKVARRSVQVGTRQR